MLQENCAICIHRNPVIHDEMLADPGAQHLALGWIGQVIAQQATLLAYIDVFWVAACFAALMVPLALILLRPVDVSEVMT